MLYMKYFIGKRVAGTPEFEIDETLFHSCKESKTILLSCLSIEEKYECIYDGSLVGLSVYRNDGLKNVGSIPLVREWDDIRIQLQMRNEILVNLHKRYATGKPTEQRKS